MHRLDPLCRGAVDCRSCFVDLPIQAPEIDVAHPRIVFPDYWTSSPRILVLALNPGSGEGRKDDANTHARAVLHRYRRGEATLEEVFAQQAEDLPRWGGGRYLPFYTTRLGLELERLAFANVAWCGTLGNQYPPAMLRRCFAEHTESLLRVLAPNVVLLSGSGVHAFEKQINELLPHARTIPCLHFAHRKGRAAEEGEAARIRPLLIRDTS